MTTLVAERPGISQAAVSHLERASGICGRDLPLSIDHSIALHQRAPSRPADDRLRSERRRPRPIRKLRHGVRRSSPTQLKVPVDCTVDIARLGARAGLVQEPYGRLRRA